MTIPVPLRMPLEHWRAFMLRARQRVNVIVPAVFEQGLFFGGLTAIAYGAWMVYRPLGPIVGGVFAVKVAFLIAAERK